MSDLVAFLRARLDEDEINAGLARAQWPNTHFTIDPGSLIIVEFHRRHDPARVLRETEAKRKILAMHESCGYGAGYCDDGGHGYEDGGCGNLEALAAVYSDHPDYDPRWRQA